MDICRTILKMFFTLHFNIMIHALDMITKEHLDLVQYLAIRHILAVMIILIGMKAIQAILVLKVRYSYISVNSSIFPGN